MRRSFTGPLLLVVVGGLFLWHNLYPEAPLFDTVARYWPFVLIAWGLVRLIEVSIWRDRGIRRGFSGGEIVLIVLICLAGSGIWAAREHAPRFVVGGLEFWGQQYDYPVSVKAAAGAAKRIVFENPRGYVKVTGGDGLEVIVNGHKTIRAFSKNDADSSDAASPVEIIPQGDRLMVRTNQDRVRNNIRITDDLEVTVPRGVSIESRGTTGDHEITDINGDVDISTGRGDMRLVRIGGNVRVDASRSETIHLADVKGRVDLQGHGNDVDMENIGGQVTVGGTYTGTLELKNLAKPLQFEGSRGTELSAQAVPGRITMDLSEFDGRDITGPMRLVTRARDIRVQQVTQSLEVATERGDIELTPGKTPLPVIDAQTGAGKIDLFLPEKAAFHLEATARRGEAVNDYGSPLEKSAEGRSATLTGRVGDGPSIKLTARQGTITVGKQGAPDSEDAADSPNGKGRKITPKELKDSETKM